MDSKNKKHEHNHTVPRNLDYLSSLRGYVKLFYFIQCLEYQITQNLVFQTLDEVGTTRITRTS